MRKYISYGIIYICLFIVIQTPLFSQSMFSTIGIGKLNYFLNTRSSGMGYVGLAVPDNISYSRINPALSAGFKETSFNASFTFEGLKITSSETAFNASLSRLNGASLSIKIIDGLVITGGLFPVSDYEFEFISPDDEQAAYQLGVTGNGGINAGNVGIGYKINENISVGLSYNRLFGRLEEMTDLNFYDDEYTDTEDSIEKILSGNQLSAGVLYSVNKRAKVGGFFTLGCKLDGDVEFGYSYLSESKKVADVNYHLPYSFGVGGMYQLNPKLLIGSDLRMFRGSQLKYNGSIMKVVQDAFMFSGGCEYTPSKQNYDSYSSRMSYRAGFYVHSPYLKDADYSSIREYFVTGGLGFPFNRNNARIDFSMELGMRGSKNSDLASEKIIRFTIGFSSNEKWFYREDN